jgi:hypothetical protein
VLQFLFKVIFWENPSAVEEFHLLFYLGPSLIGWGPPTLCRTNCFAQNPQI